MLNVGICNVKVNNISVNCRKYVVANLVDGELWYYGSWDDKAEADRVAKELGALVVERV